LPRDILELAFVGARFPMAYKLILALLAVSGWLAAATVEGTVKDPSQVPFRAQPLP